MQVGRLLLVAVVLVSTLASSTEDYAELSDVLGAGEASLSEWHNINKPETAAYSKIPFFALKHKAKKATNAKTVKQCQSLCSGNKGCKSFSFSVRKRDCLWSTTALAFNGHFTFYSKRANPKKPMKGGLHPMSPYRSFVGLMYQSKDWTQYKGHSKESCQDLCNRAKDSWGRSCHGFSYRAHDETCLLSPFGVHYDTDYDYYERNPHFKKAKGKKKAAPKPVLQKKFKPKKKKKVPGPKMSSEYKTRLSVDEGKAKWGKKELAHKQTLVKVVKRGKKKLKLKIKILAKKKAKLKKKLGKKTKEKHEETLAEERSKKRAIAEKTQKKFILVRKKQAEKKRKKQHESSTKLAKQKAKMREKLSKELKYKTKAKKIEKGKKEHKAKLKGKIDNLIKMSIRLTAAERRNKKRGYKEKEHATKEKLVKMQIAHVKGRRHARHKRQYAKFVKQTLKKHMKKAKTATRVAVAMKQNMKQRKKELAHALLRQKKLRALVHLIGLNIAKMKAKANGYQHSINISAKRGKKAPGTEVKLRFTMNGLRAEQRKDQFKKQKLVKLGREVDKRLGAVKRLDARMTQLAVGRRRRAKNTKVKKKKVKMPKLTAKTPKNNIGVRRRRTKARLGKRFTKQALQAAGAGLTKLPAVPSGGTSA